MLTPDMICDVERRFLSPFHRNNKTLSDGFTNTPLLEDFDSEIQIYVVSFFFIINPVKTRFFHVL
jgi:hypothetical protein